MAQGLSMGPGSVTLFFREEISAESLHDTVEAWARDTFHFEQEGVGGPPMVMTWHCPGRRILITRLEVMDGDDTFGVIVRVYGVEGIDAAQSQELAKVLEARFS